MGKKSTLGALINFKMYCMHTAVSVAFSVPSSVQIKKQSSEKLLLFIVTQPIQRKGEEQRDRPIGN